MKKATLRPVARFPRWFAVIGVITLTLTSCAGLPSPSGREPALLVIMVEGPVGAHQVQFERHSTGLREIELSPSARPGLSVGGPEPPSSVQLNLRPNSVTLFPYLVEEYSRGPFGGGQLRNARVVRPLSDAERRAAAEHLTDHVRFFEWVGGSYYGFGSYAALLGRTTDRYRVSIDSRPPGAEVAIDAEPVGTTPLTLQLPAGRYLADLSAQAHDPARLVLDISSDTELMVELPERSETEAPQLSEYGLVIQRFATLVPDEDDLFTVPFGNSLETVLQQDERILVLAAGHRPAQENLNLGGGADDRAFRALFAPHLSSAAPDFAFAESRGAELILAGYYTTREQELFVNATLYDVRTRGVKTNTVLVGRGGLELFNTVDEMADELSAAVDRVLPERSEAGTAAAELVTAELTGTERRTAEREVVLRRHSRPHIIGPSLRS
ncbi:MAG: PEGA domain-containing protein [Spirochaeta sp.]|nr:PEGA domain-containing protein [Spirochaeta sp.]